MPDTLRLTTMDGDVLEVDVYSGYVNMRFYDLKRQTPDDHTPIGLSTEASLKLREALHLGMV